MPVTSTSRSGPVPPTYPVTKRYRFGWIAEMVGIVALALAHDTVRNAVMGSAKVALRNAKTLTAIERSLGIYHEQGMLDGKWVDVVIMEKVL